MIAPHISDMILIDWNSFLFNVLLKYRAKHKSPQKWWKHRLIFMLLVQMVASGSRCSAKCTIHCFGPVSHFRIQTSCPICRTASNCVDVSSSVTAIGLQTCMHRRLNLSFAFLGMFCNSARGYLCYVRYIESSHYMTCFTTRS